MKKNKILLLYADATQTLPVAARCTKKVFFWREFMRRGSVTAIHHDSLVSGIILQT